MLGVNCCTPALVMITFAERMVRNTNKISMPPKKTLNISAKSCGLKTIHAILLFKP